MAQERIQNDAALLYHAALRGKIEVVPKRPLEGPGDLALAYTPGVAAPCRAIARDADAVYTYTGKGNTIAIVTDGSAILGLGNIGPAAGLPVMEGKAVLFKLFADVDAVPICLGTTEPDRIIDTVALLEPSFGGVNLEDIASPRCFEVESGLGGRLSIPVFNDDQHGTAVVVAAAVQNALRLVGKSADAVRVVINGAGAAGTAVARLLLLRGIGDVVAVDREGILERNRTDLPPAKWALAQETNPALLKGGLIDALRGADVFVGVSVGGILTADMVRTMNRDAIVFAMANPTPEIYPAEALAGGAAVVGTGRSDFPNQINNVLAFPGIMRGALDVRSRSLTRAMYLAAADAIAELVGQDLSPQHIIPEALDERVAPAVAEAVAQAAMAEGLARVHFPAGEVATRTRERVEDLRRRLQRSQPT